jgi:putative tricarboxylic transport membrane protein
VSSAIDSVVPRLRDVLHYWRTILRSGAIGTFIGAMPGLGEDIAAWTSYAAAKRASAERERFGKGSIEGLMAAETGESACVPGAIIPVLTLAVPGSAPAAVLMAAMMIHGLNPGPMLAITTPEFIYQIVAMLIVADMVKLFYGLVLVRPLLWVLLIPRERLMPVVFVLCTVGAFAITSRLFDIWVMLGAGLIGFVLRDLLDKNLLRGLVLSGGDLSPFFTRPISAALCALTLLAALWSIPGVAARLRGAFRRPREAEAGR